MGNMRISICVGMLITGILFCCAASAGPIDNANEFVEKAVTEAEEGGNSPADQSPDTPAISWAGNDTSAAVNTGETSSADAQ